MRCYRATITAPWGLHARACAMLHTVRRLYFPKDEIILVNLKDQRHASMESIGGLMMLGVVEGGQVEFVTAMDEETFAAFEEVFSLLSYVPTTDSHGSSDVDYAQAAQPIWECEGDRRLLIYCLRVQSRVPGRMLLFSPTQQNKRKPPVPIAPTQDKPDEKQTFISYAHPDLGFVQSDLIPLVHVAGLVPWFSNDSIRGADRWERSILSGLQTSAWFIVVMSSHAVASEWVRLEVHWASEHRQDKIVPLMISDCDPWKVHMRLGNLQYVDFRVHRDDAQSKLLSVLRSQRTLRTHRGLS
jgi:phosphotransferase system HPr (HPr) family protein